MMRVAIRSLAVRSCCPRFGHVQFTQRLQHREFAVRSAAVDDYDPEGVERLLPPTVQRRLTKLREMQTNRKDVDLAFWKEKMQLEKKYEAQYAELWQQRLAVISGTEAVSDYGIEDDAEDKDEGIPDFWLTAMSNHPALDGEVSDSDAAVLSYLEDVRSSILLNEDEQLGGFQLNFVFRENPYFTNRELTKTYLLEMGISAPFPKLFQGCKIDWAPGKDCTVKEVTKKVKTAKGKFVVQKSREPQQSFFNFFNPPVLPEEPESENESDLEELQNELDRDFEMGLAFKEDLIPDAVLWYTGEATPENYDDFDGEDYMDGELGEDEDFGDDDVEEEVSKGGKGKPLRR